MPIAKPEFIKGNRGRDRQMTCGDAMRYNGNSREEKGRESSTLLDGYGRQLTVEEAIELLGGEDAKYHNSILNFSDADREFLEERFGGREEAQRAMGLLILERTDAKDGLFAIHDHGERGWHLHITHPELPTQKLYGQYGLFQKVWDREMEALRGEGGRPITDWDAHEEFQRSREELSRVQLEQRTLAKDRYMALRATPDQDEKQRIRKDFEARELALIRQRRELELAAAEARYRSRGNQGNASHRIEIERIEARAATAVTRLETRNLGQDLKLDRINAWAQFREPEARHKALMKTLEAERARIDKAHAVEVEEARQRAERAGTLGSDSFRREVALIDARRDAQVEDSRMKIQEAKASLQRSRSLAFAVGPLSRTFLERRELERLSSLAREREAMEIRHADRKHELAETLGSDAHRRDLERAQLRRRETEERNRRSFLNGFQPPRACRLISDVLKASRTQRLAQERVELEISWAQENFRNSVQNLEDKLRNRIAADAGRFVAKSKQLEEESSKKLVALGRAANGRIRATRTSRARAQIEYVERGRLEAASTFRFQRATAAVEQAHTIAGTLGSRVHRDERLALEAKRDQERQIIKGKKQVATPRNYRASRTGRERLEVRAFPSGAALFAQAYGGMATRRLIRDRHALEASWVQEDKESSIRKLEASHEANQAQLAGKHEAAMDKRRGDLKARIREIQLKAAERGVAARQPVLRSALSRGPLGRAAVDLVEGKRLLAEAKTRHGREVAQIDARHQVAGTFGSESHMLEQRAAAQKLKEEKTRIRGRGRQVARDAAAAKGRQAVSKTTSTLKQAAAKVVESIRQELRPDDHLDRQSRQAAAAARPAKNAAQAAMKAIQGMAQEAAIAGAKMGKEVVVHGTMATSKLALGAITAIPTGGASLKVAAKEAGRDLAEGAKGAAKEAAQGAKNVSREGAAGVTKTALSTLQGVKGLAENLLPGEGAAAVKAAQEASKTVGKVGLNVLQLDLAGAGRAAVLGGLKTSKELAAAAAKAAELPGALKLPLAVVEKLPVIGQVATIGKEVAEIASKAAKSVEFDL